MSHSYKKHNIYKIAGDTSYKKIFNRRLRRSDRCKDIPNGAAYKKYNNSWDIADYVYSTSWEYFRDSYRDSDISEKELWAIWKRIYGTK